MNCAPKEESLENRRNSKNNNKGNTNRNSWKQSVSARNEESKSSKASGMDIETQD